MGLKDFNIEFNSWIKTQLEVQKNGLFGSLDKVWKDIKNIDLPTFPRLSWRECMERYGSDKPDIRYDMELIDVSNAFVNSSFEFLNGKIIKAIVAKNAAGSFTRKDIDVLTENAKKNKAKSLMWFKVNEDKLEGASAKLVNEEEANELKKLLNYENGDLVLVLEKALKGFYLLYSLTGSWLVHEETYDVIVDVTKDFYETTKNKAENWYKNYKESRN